MFDDDKSSLNLRIFETSNGYLEFNIKKDKIKIVHKYLKEKEEITEYKFEKSLKV